MEWAERALSHAVARLTARGAARGIVGRGSIRHAWIARDRAQRLRPASAGAQSERGQPARTEERERAHQRPADGSALSLLLVLTYSLYKW